MLDKIIRRLGYIKPSDVKIPNPVVEYIENITFVDKPVFIYNMTDIITEIVLNEMKKLSPQKNIRIYRFGNIR